MRGLRMMKNHVKQFKTIPRVVVVGAAGGGLDRWRQWAMMGQIKGAGFEPDPIECGNLRKAYPFAEFHQFALGDKSGPVKLYVTSSPQCTSCLEPDIETLAPYSASSLFKVEKTEQVTLRRFDELCKEGVVSVPHFLQADVQGFEYNVMEGFGSYLDDLVGIEVESHFINLYNGQKTLWQIIDFLKSHGFVLRHLETQGPFGGELVEVNAFFSRLLKSDEKEKRSLVKIWELVCALPHYEGTREGLI